MKHINGLIFVLAMIVAIAIGAHCQTAQAGQQGTYTNSVTFPEHTQHADVKSLQTDGGVTVASGTLPLSDFYTTPAEPVYEQPLGDVARKYRTTKEKPCK